MASVALVLGAGGAAGGAYEAGALAAIARVTGWQAGRAELIVGTSAGAALATALRLGFSAEDQYRRAQRLPMSDAGEALVADLPPEPLALPPVLHLDPVNLLRPTAPWLTVPAFLAPGPVRPGLLAGWLPRGHVPTSPMGDRFRTMLRDRWPAGWPDRPTWICAVRTRDGKRCVFGRDDIAVSDIATAVEASSAVPGYFHPVAVGEHMYMDGATYSPTNADLVAGLGFDLVIAIAPMSAVSADIRPSPLNVARAYHARVLGREVARIRSRGTTVITVQPVRDDLDVMGRDWLNMDKAPAIARRAYETVGAYLESEAIRERVARLRDIAGEQSAP